MPKNIVFLKPQTGLHKTPIYRTKFCTHTPPPTPEKTLLKVGGVKRRGKYKIPAGGGFKIYTPAPQLPIKVPSGQKWGEVGGYITKFLPGQLLKHCFPS